MAHRAPTKQSARQAGPTSGPKRPTANKPSPQRPGAITPKIGRSSSAGKASICSKSSTDHAGRGKTHAADNVTKANKHLFRGWQGIYEGNSKRTK